MGAYIAPSDPPPPPVCQVASAPLKAILGQIIGLRSSVHRIQSTICHKPLYNYFCLERRLLTW